MSNINLMDLSVLLLFFFIIFSCILGIVLFSISFFFIERKEDSEKLSAYECGFMPFEDARGTFNIKFYLVSMLFLIFDLEIVFLFPWSLSLGSMTGGEFFVMMLFLFLLIIGFIYEWCKGALDWHDV